MHLLSRASCSSSLLERCALRCSRRAFSCAERDGFSCGKPMLMRATISGSVTLSSKHNISAKSQSTAAAEAGLHQLHLPCSRCSRVRATPGGLPRSVCPCRVFTFNSSSAIDCVLRKLPFMLLFINKLLKDIVFYKKAALAFSTQLHS